MNSSASLWKKLSSSKSVRCSLSNALVKYLSIKVKVIVSGFQIPAFMRIILLLILLLPFAAKSQGDYAMDELALHVPPSKTASVAVLGDYFARNSPDDRRLVRAIFAWITFNIRYF